LILAPVVGRKAKTGEEITGENGDEKNPQARLSGFRAVYVFDISQTEGKGLPVLTEVQSDVSGYRERLVKFVEAKRIEPNYSAQIRPPKACHTAGRLRSSPGCSLPRNSLRWCMRSDTYVAQRFMWRLPRDAHKDGSITADQRHIIVE
jgi:hypothetical protein